MLRCNGTSYVNLSRIEDTLVFEHCNQHTDRMLLHKRFSMEFYAVCPWGLDGGFLGGCRGSAERFDRVPSMPVGFEKVAHLG